MRLHRIATLVLGVAVGLAGLGGERAAAQVSKPAMSPWVEGHMTRGRLVAGLVPGEGGDRLMAGLEIQLGEGWKTYWRTPGSSGVPPNFDFKASRNAGTPTVLYPAPRRLAEPDGDVIGYKGRALFPIAFRAEDAAKPVELKLTVELGVCKDICVPVTLNLALALPQAPAPPPSLELAAALDAVPRPADRRRSGDPVIERQVATLKGDKPRLVFEAAFPAGTTGADLFVEAPDGAWVPFAVVKPDADGRRVTFDIDLSAGADLKDLIGKTLTVTVVGPTGSLETTTLLKAE